MSIWCLYNAHFFHLDLLGLKYYLEHLLYVNPFAVLYNSDK